MVKFFEWSSAATTELLPAPAQNKRYRILSLPMACNEQTGKAVVHEGATPPTSGAANVIDFVDSVRASNVAPLPAPFLTTPKIPVYLTTTDSGGTTAGRGIIVYIEEAY